MNDDGSFAPVVAGSALGATAPAPVTPSKVAHRGGTPNQSAEALRQQFGAAVRRVDVVWGETTVVIDPARVHDVIRWLHDDPSQRYDYLSDVTAVEFRDLEQPIEVVWHLRSLPYRRFIRVKAL
ncbi:MAG TPA: NADH-quinone oxidoreductase subunit C, partial [Gemmatimonadaceae bacterium]|nr:NADH-quinone oxidoreductase subunit C [Gemmatimonadaceae bacterium]